MSEIEPVTDEDAAIARMTLAEYPLCINTHECMRAILEQDRRRVAERQANHGTTHAEGCASWGRGHYECAMVETERLRAEVARLNEERAENEVNQPAIEPVTEIDHHYTDDPVCPHCGYRRRDAWEINFGPCLEGDTEIQCGNEDCERIYQVSRNCSITYSTSVKP